MCDECKVETDEIMECCSSGSCEVCNGMQGAIRQSVYETRHGPVPF